MPSRYSPSICGALIPLILVTSIFVGFELLADKTHDGKTIYAVHSELTGGGGLFGGGSRNGFWAVDYHQEGNCFENGCGEKFCSDKYEITPSTYYHGNGYAGGVCFQSIIENNI